MSGTATKVVVSKVRPILSRDHHEARLRVLSLYKAWLRTVPFLVHRFKLPKSEGQTSDKIREEFGKHRHVTDIRVIDLLVVKGQMELKEVAAEWKQPCHVMTYWQESVEPKPKDFLSKFIAGSD